MRKRIIAMVVALSIILAAFSGCGIITKNADRDLAQIVANVGYSKTGNAENFVYREFSVEKESGLYVVKYKDTPKQLTKRQLVNAFNNIGSQYIQQGMTVKEALDAIMKQLVQREIIVQEAIRQVATKPYANGFASVDDCLTDEEKAEAEAKVYDEEYEIIKGYFEETKKLAEEEEDKEEDEEEEEEHEEHSTRQTPVAEDDEKYEPKYTKDDEKYEGKEAGYWESAIRRYNKNLKRSETGLNRDIYHLRLVESEKEQMVINKYQEYIEKKAVRELLATDSETTNAYFKEEGISDTVKEQRAKNYVERFLDKRYETDFNKQKVEYQNNIAGFTSALDAYTGDFSLLYNPISNSGNFLVKNLLVGIEGELKEQLDEIKNLDLNDAAKQSKRAELLGQIEGTDKRSPLEHKTDNKSGDEYDTKFDFPAWLPNATDKKIIEVADSKYGDEYKTEDKESGDSSVAKISFTNSATALSTIKSELQTLMANAEFKASEYYDRGKTAAENALATLIFKYGTDPGMQNNAFDYLVKQWSANTTEKYVAEFAYGSRASYKKFLASSEATLEGKQLDSMVIIPSDFGWHIVMVTAVLDSEHIYELNYKDLAGSPIKEDTEVTGYEKTFTYNFSEKFLNENISEAYSKAQVEIIDRYSKTEGYVINYENVYKDLV